MPDWILREEGTACRSGPSGWAKGSTRAFMSARRGEEAIDDIAGFLTLAHDPRLVQ
ncbi:hypothetical protein [Paenirhodobacter populi]|uniref:hypothetical protein n=1 Tax=Paenirhodobacter populi TaxID=2306993 RepID=UPI0013E39FF1|nr:hypothetical protein [Sinirhodobacter populi]